MNTVTSNTGAVVIERTYSPYGEMHKIVRDGTAFTDTPPVGFAGRPHDELNKTINMRNRYYSYELRRFISEDPLGVEAGLNFYAYVGGDPVNFTDPWGLMDLSNDPSGLDPNFWRPDPSHQDPNGVRFRDSSDNTLDFNRGRPGWPGNRGRNHWHYNEGNDHLKPGDKVPDPKAPFPSPTAKPWWDKIPKRIPGLLPLIIWPKALDDLINGRCGPA